jgi:hypothetical protein
MIKIGVMGIKVWDKMFSMLSEGILTLARQQPRQG